MLNRTSWPWVGARPVVASICVSLLWCSLSAFAQSPDSDAGKVQFDVWEYRVLGNTTLPVARIEQALYGLTGPNKTLADVEVARQALEKTYHDAGFGTVFVDIPEQGTEEGIVRLQVTEGHLDRVHITGTRYFSNRSIRAALPAIESGKVPRLPDVQAQIAELNSVTPDRTVVPVLKAGQTPGTVDLDLKVNDQLPVHGSLELNNRYTPDTSPLRINAGITFGNLFQQQQSFSLQYQTSPQNTDDVRAIVGNYVFRIAAWKDMTFAIYAVDSNSDVAALGTTSVLGKGQILGLRAIRTLPVLTSSYFHSLTIGLDYKDFLEDIRLSDQEGLATPIHYLNWSLAYGGTHREEKGTTVFDLSANFGVRGAVNDPDEFENKRFKGAPNYFYIRAGAQHVRQLPWDLSLFGRVSGQFTQDALVSNEQFAIGGLDTVRGYFESSELGDYGFGGTLEVRNAFVSQLLHLPANAAYVFAFYDAGIVYVVKSLPQQEPSFDLASWGVGFQLVGSRGFDIVLDWARVLNNAGITKRGDSRVLFALKYSF